MTGTGSKLLEEIGVHQSGLQQYAFWVSFLDPWTKNKAAKILEENDLVQLWSDITAEIMCMKESSATTDTKESSNKHEKIAVHERQEKQA